MTKGYTPHPQGRKLMNPPDSPGLPHPPPISPIPVRFSKSQVGIRHRAPLLGEHTEEILQELGYSAEEIGDLRKARAV